jgi:dUTP pyrophosphatase
MILVKVLNSSGNRIPSVQTLHSAGFDLASNEDVVLHPNSLRAISTGLQMVIPEGWEGQVRPRSSVGMKGVYIPNAPGTIDSDYRGEIKVLLHNLSSSTFRIYRGNRIAQLVIAQVPPVTMEVVTPKEFEAYADTERGDGGFGSTGVK